MSKSHSLGITDGLIMHVRVIAAVPPVAQDYGDNLIELYVVLIIIHTLEIMITN